MYLAWYLWPSGPIMKTLPSLVQHLARPNFFRATVKVSCRDFVRYLERRCQPVPLNLVLENHTAFFTGVSLNLTNKGRGLPESLLTWPI
ncbi:unnamed protein product [Colias eurytheme]|nr:unnamed protein product [Colias eurytheme]